MSSAILQLRNSERAFHSSLARLVGLLESRPAKGMSSFDPLSSLVQQSEVLASVAQGLLKKHEVLVRLLQDASLDDEQEFNSWLNDAELLGLYSTLLNGALKLIFGLNFTSHRFSATSEFASLIVSVYQRLKQLSSVGGQPSAQIISILHSFECHFKTQWNTADSHTFEFDNVRDLISSGHNVVCPPVLDLATTVKRDFFTLTIQEMGFENLLVELFQLSSGELAVFEVKCGQLPHTLNSVKQLLQLYSVSRGTQSMKLGRSLLFPTLRKDDLCIVSESSSGVVLKSKLGSNTQVKLSAVDPTQWGSHWKTYFRRLFSNPLFTPDGAAPSSMHMTKSAHPFQNFKLKHDKLTSLRPEGDYGLAVTLNQTENFNSSRHASNIAELPNETLLHKSRPLDDSLSSQLPSSDSFAELEKLDYEALLRVNESISMNSSPVSRANSTFNEASFKRVDSSSSVERVEVTCGEYTEECESIVSSHEEEKEVPEPFDLSSEFHRPQLTKRKSSSLLSLFSSNKSKTSLKNHKNLTLDLPSGNSTTSLLTLPTPKSPNSLPLQSPQRDEFCSLPERYNLDDGYRIYDNSVQVSYWHVNSWRAVAKGHLSFALQECRDGEVLCLISDTSKKNKYKFCATVSPEWKVTRSAAQDVQLKFPSLNVISSALPADATVISLRCLQVDKLVNTLHHCIRQNLPSKIKASSTYGTLSTTSSTFSAGDKCVSRSDTTSTGLSSISNDISNPVKDNVVSLLLLSNVKVRLHERRKEHGWVVKSKGLLDVYSQEFRGQVSAIKFDLIFEQGQKTEFRSKLDNIRRIGRTGVSLIHDQDDYLIEFKNQIVANEVFNLITCLI